MINRTLITLGKTVSLVSKTLNRGNGSTWPGHIALKGNKNFIRDILTRSKTKIIIIAGTNGKTTTARLIRTGLQKNGKSVLHNASGANLLNGIASTILLHTNAHGELSEDYAIFEVDENVIPIVLEQITPDYLVMLNLFRDQLDRYGELNTIAQKWSSAINLTPGMKLVLNADDPQIAYIGIKAPQTSYFFSLLNKKNNPKTHQAADSTYCPQCGNKLTFHALSYSHLGDWSCNTCGLKRPKPVCTEFPVYPLAGTYNEYNTIAAALLLKELGLTEEDIKNAFINFKPAFGRQEKVTYNGRTVQFFLSKNPTSFNQSFQTIKECKEQLDKTKSDGSATALLLVLNDRIPDGRDVSWIWDTDLTGVDTFKYIIVSGDRTYDMGLRLKYAQTMSASTFRLEPDLHKAITKAIELIPEKGTLFVLPTYSAMLDVRKIITGKKIL